MRRIYESEALRRDSEHFTPNERRDSVRPRAMRSIDPIGVSRALVPNRVGRRAISIDVSTPRTEYPTGTAVPFRVTMRNSMPFPIAIPTTSPIRWTWAVDGLEEASHVRLHDPPDEPGELVFDRGERKRFTKRWHQSFRVADDEWTPAEPGTYTISAALNVDDPAEKGLCDETTIRLVEESEETSDA